jgi:hypothetical protein
MWRIGWAPNNANKWQMGFNSAFKGFIYIKLQFLLNLDWCETTSLHHVRNIQSVWEVTVYLTYLFISLCVHFITLHDFTWLGNPVWQCKCDKAVKTQHTGSHFLIISSVLCDTGNGRYEQLFHCGAFGSKLGSIKRQLRSGIEWGVDNISEVIWVAILAQSNSFIMRKMRLFIRECERFSGEQLTKYPKLWHIPLQALSLNFHHSSMYRN